MAGRTILIVPGIIASVLVGLFIGLGSYTFIYAKGYSYISNDPKVCANCHIMNEQYDGWQKGSHHAVAVCNDCHTPHDLVGKYYTKAENGYHHSKAFTLQNFHEPIQIRPKNKKILEHNCLRCHSEFVEHITTYSNELNDKSLDEYNEVDCVRCHKDVGHGPVR